jgi:hypothetical protein
MDTTNWKVTEAPTCPHCKQLMEQMDSRFLDRIHPFSGFATIMTAPFQRVGAHDEGRGAACPAGHDPSPERRAGVIPAFNHHYIRDNGEPASPNYDEE